MRIHLSRWGKGALAAVALSATVALLIGCSTSDFLDCNGDCWITDGDISMYDWGTRSECEAWAREESNDTGDTWWVETWDSYC
jgi:hypothetical protein